MAEQFKNPEAAKLEDVTVTDATATKKIDHVAEKAATKAAKTEQHYDKTNNNLFTK